MKDLGEAHTLPDASSTALPAVPPRVPLEAFRLAFEQVGVGLALLDRTGVPLTMNDHLAAALGPDGPQLVTAAVTPMLASAGPSTTESFVVGRGLTGRVHAVHAPDGQLAWYVLTVVQPGAGKDPLTGLAGRSALLDRLTTALARRDPLDLELVVVDLDDFKGINDRHGHVVGDEVLVGTASRLLALVRPEDGVYRWGGDEFVILLEDAATTSGAVVSHRLEEMLRTPLVTRIGNVTVSASCGWVQACSDDSPVSLLHRADLRMYAAKRSRRCGPGTEDLELRARIERTRARSRELAVAVAAWHERVAVARTAIARSRRPDRSA